MVSLQKFVDSFSYKGMYLNIGIKYSFFIKKDRVDATKIRKNSGKFKWKYSFF